MRAVLDNLNIIVLCSGAHRCNPSQTKDGGDFCRHSIPHAKVCRCGNKPCPFAGESGMVKCTQNATLRFGAPAVLNSVVDTMNQKGGE